VPRFTHASRSSSGAGPQRLSCWALHAAPLAESTARRHAAIWFQLVKMRLASFEWTLCNGEVSSNDRAQGQATLKDGCPSKPRLDQYRDESSRRRLVAVWRRSFQRRVPLYVSPWLSVTTGCVSPLDMIA
jgi:hypothetical protein